MKGLNKGLPFLLILVLLFSGMSFAESEPIKFDDVPTDSWYYEGVMTMSAYGVITGYPNGKFLPMNEVSREEFAVMMVRALKLGKSGGDSSFEDIEDEYWAVPYIESAKVYLTGYKTGTGISFKPKYDAVREDMAVSLVKALGYKTSDAQLNLLDKFEDKDQISDNLKPYVALAYEKELINGAQEDDGLYFNPKKTLTRAEAAVLLLAVIKEEEISFDEEKVVLGDDEYLASRLRVEVEDDVAYLKWDKINHRDFEGYKLVVSQYDSTPSYPENGYMKYFTDDDVTGFQVKKNQKVNNSDFSKIKQGTRYYATITTLYKDGKKTSNTVSFMLKEKTVTEYIRPSLRIEQSGDEAKLFWTQVKHPKFKYYKLVVSSKNSTPKYPDNGYMYAISNYEKNSIEIGIGDKGNHSDFSKILEDEQYYVAVSAVYDDQTLTSNVVKMKLTDEEDDKDKDKEEEAYIKPTLSASNFGGVVVLDWNKIDHSEFEGYKVVISKENNTPSYPDDGYMIYLTDKNTTEYVIELGDKPNNADFDKVEENVTYHVAITVIYDDKRLTSDPVTFTLDE